MFRSLLICLLLFTCSVHAADELEALKTAAEQGDADAQYDLGSIYASGAGIPEDDAKAVYWYRKAAEQGYVSAQNSLGLMYAKAQGSPRITCKPMLGSALLLHKVMTMHKKQKKGLPKT